MPAPYYGMAGWPSGVFVYYNRLKRKDSNIFIESDPIKKERRSGNFGIGYNITKVINQLEALAYAEAEKEAECMHKLDPNNLYFNKKGKGVKLKDGSRQKYTDMLYRYRMEDVDRHGNTYRYRDNNLTAEYIMQFQAQMNLILQGKNDIQEYLGHLMEIVNEDKKYADARKRNAERKKRNANKKSGEAHEKMEENRNTNIAPHEYAFIAKDIQKRIKQVCQEVVDRYAQTINGNTVIGDNKALIKQMKQELKKEIVDLFNDKYIDEIIRKIAGIDEQGKYKQGKYFDRNLELLLNKNLTGEDEETKWKRLVRERFSKAVITGLGIEGLADRLSKSISEYMEEGLLDKRATKGGRKAYNKSDNLKEDVQKMKQAGKTVDIKVSASTIIDKAFGHFSTAKLSEIATNAAAVALASSRNANTKKGGNKFQAVGTSTFHGDEQTTDSYVVFSTQLSIEVTTQILEILESINSQGDDDDPKKDKTKKENARKSTKRAIEEIQAILKSVNAQDNSVIIATNNKMYSLKRSNGEGKIKTFDQYGFSGGSRNLRDIPHLVDRYKMGNAEHILLYLINTLDGAVMHRNRKNVCTAMSEVIIQNFMEYMFDDWDDFSLSVPTDISGGRNVIHILNLDGVLLSSSGFLFSLVRALRDAIGGDNGKKIMERGKRLSLLEEEADQYVKVSFGIMNKKINWQHAKDTTAWIGDQKKADGVPRGRRTEVNYLYKAWEQQRDDALDTTYSVTFLKNFIEIIQQMQNALGVLKQ